MHDRSAVRTFLFTDIEGSTRLWEQQPERMAPALARHDAIARAAVESNRGAVVKTTGDGMHAVFEDPADAVRASVALQLGLADPGATDGLALKVRCGLHVGSVERRDNDYFGSPVNRAARIMAAAHGGQVLLSQAVADLARERLPDGASLRDLGAVRLRDLATAEHVYQVVHPQLRCDFPALRSLESTPNNLPQQLTSFVGRERELAEVGALLRSVRLLTLVGAGGLGKTRLSLQAAANAIDDYPDGVWLVELAPLADAQLVPQAVASVLGVKEEAGRTVLEALVAHARDRRFLLILDNCEHVVQACADLAKQLLQAAPDVTILASSRERLNVSGERTYPLPTLAVPDPAAALAPEAFSRFESVRLFADRAVLVQPGFAVSRQNQAAVGEICHRLDGIPLALELAAARVRTLSVEQIAARLGDRFRLLAGGDRTALPRQQTLRALIDWSYNLLSAPERTLFRRLAVFAGGWTLEAAEAVCAAEAIGQAEVLDLLSSLVEKSLVALEAEGGRYRLLETVRDYARDRLDESGESGGGRAAHLACFLDLAERARPELVGPDQGAWRARMDVERENFLAAHAWCDHAADGAALGLRLATAMRRYWIMSGLLGIGYRVTVEALARSREAPRDLARCRALFDAGQLGSWMGRYAEAQRFLEEGLAIARELGAKPEVAGALQPLALACLGQGDRASARRHLEEALALSTELGDTREVAAALNALAQIHRADGRLDEAEPLYERVLSLARGLGDREVTAIALLNLAMVSIGRGGAAAARDMLLETADIAAEIGAKTAGQSVLEVSAGLAAMRAHWERTARLFGAAEAQTRQTGLHRDPADEAFLAPLIAKARDALGEQGFAAAEAAGRALSYEEAMAEARLWLEGG